MISELYDGAVARQHNVTQLRYFNLVTLCHQNIVISQHHDIGGLLMKQDRNSAALAAELLKAAKEPLPLPEKQSAAVIAIPHGTETEAAAAVENPETEGAPPVEARRSKKAAKGRTVLETVAITLRPSRELLNDYTMAAAERTKATGKVISAQEIMLEVLERGRSKIQK
jgi:hypothetical protein